MSSSTEQSVDWALQMLVVAGAAAFAHALFLAGNWGVVKAWSLAGHDNADSYIMEGSAFDEKAHVAQGEAPALPLQDVHSQTSCMPGFMHTRGWNLVLIPDSAEYKLLPLVSLMSRS